MKKIKFLIIIISSFSLLLCFGCDKKEQHQHTWQEATCLNAKVCTECGETEGNALGHNWIDATCTTAKYCQRCGETEGVALGHQWTEATLTAPKTCTRCQITEGEPLKPSTIIEATLNHSYISVGSKTRLIVKNYYDLTAFYVEFSKENIISMDNYGLIEGLNIGLTTITLTLKTDPLSKVSFDIEVISKQPSIYVTSTRMELNDSTSIFFRNLNELKEESINDFDITFENGNILTLDKDKKLIATQYGTDTVTITSKLDKRITSSVEISVVSANSFVILYGKDETGIVKAGEQFQFQIANSLCQNSELKWISSDSKTAVITDQGVVTLKKEGNVTITVYDPTNPSDDTKKINYVITIIGETEADYISRFIHMALRENGVHETGNNYQKYGEWYPNNGQPWCAMFVSWCWYHSGLSNDILCKYQGCYAGMKWCTEKGIMHFVQDYTFTEKLENNVSSEQKATNYQPATGDIVFFLSSGMSHTGIVIYSDDLYVYTIEGNTSDQVAIKRWSLNDARITGYAHPEYPPYSSEREDFSWIALPKDDGTNWWSIVDEQQKVD